MNQNEQGQKPDNGHQHDHDIPIFIDDVQHKVPDEPISGAQLRQLSQPPVADDRDLWLEMPGSQDDVKVLLSDQIDPKPGMHFYTAPSTINPGGD